MKRCISFYALIACVALSASTPSTYTTDFSQRSLFIVAAGAMGAVVGACYGLFQSYWKLQAKKKEFATLPTKISAQEPKVALLSQEYQQAKTILQSAQEEEQKRKTALSQAQNEEEQARDDLGTAQTALDTLNREIQAYKTRCDTISSKLKWPLTQYDQKYWSQELHTAHTKVAELNKEAALLQDQLPTKNNLHIIKQQETKNKNQEHQKQQGAVVKLEKDLATIASNHDSAYRYLKDLELARDECTTLTTSTAAKVKYFAPTVLGYTGTGLLFSTLAAFCNTSFLPKQG